MFIKAELKADMKYQDLDIQEIYLSAFSQEI